MTQIVLIRPGTTDYDAQGRIQGTLHIPLNPDGRQQVLASVEWLRGKSLLALYSAPCQSARETAELLGEGLNIRPKTLDRLQNLDHGLWQGMLIDDVRRKQPKVYKQWQEHPETVCPPEGEMLSDVEERVAAALDKLLRKHRFGAIALVAPEPLASLIRERLAGGEVGDLWKACGCCGRLEVFNIQPQVRGTRMPHFDVGAVAETIDPEPVAVPVARPK
jgi:probable phosphoglycerate mutase